MEIVIDLVDLLDRKFLNRSVKVMSHTLVPKARNQFQKPVEIKRYVKINKGFLYALGLWEGDKYVYGGSVGLTNTSKELIEEFIRFLENFIENKQKIREVSINNGAAKRVYVNSWLLRRIIEKLSENKEKFITSKEDLLAYLSGKIDADGTIMIRNAYYKSGLIKITYGNKFEAERDKTLLQKFGLNGNLISYKSRNAYDLKLTYRSSLEILNLLFLKHPEKQKKLTILMGLTRR